MLLLLLEDNPNDRDIVLQWLRRSKGPPIAIVAVDTLASALARMAASPVDVVLADLNVPDSHGMDTIRALVAVGKAPIVACTGDLDEAQGIEAIRMGAQDFAAKGSFDNRSLRTILEFAVARHSAKAKAKGSRDRRGQVRP